MNTKFKIGDRVKFVGKSYYIRSWPHDLPYVGQTGTAVENLNTHGVCVRMEDGYCVAGWSDDQYEAQAQPFIINGVPTEYATQGDAEAALKLIGNHGVTYDIAQLVKRVTVKRKTVVTLEEV